MGTHLFGSPYSINIPRLITCRTVQIEQEK